MEQAIRYGITMLPAMAVVLLPLVLLRLWQVPRLRRRGIHTTPLHEVGLVLFCCYLAGLASLTILPPWELIGSLRLPQNLESEISLEPLRVFRLCYIDYQNTGRWDYLLINLVGNIAIFMPVGFFPAFLWKRCDSWKGTALWGIGTSLIIESCQLNLDRCTDIDDLWTNLLGALLGYALFRLLGRWFTFLSRGRTRR